MTPVVKLRTGRYCASVHCSNCVTVIKDCLLKPLDVFQLVSVASLSRWKMSAMETTQVTLAVRGETSPGMSVLHLTVDTSCQPQSTCSLTHTLYHYLQNIILCIPKYRQIIKAVMCICTYFHTELSLLGLWKFGIFQVIRHRTIYLRWFEAHVSISIYK